MMSKIKRSFILALMLVVVICGLEVFDAPAYVCCKDVGVCEFLEVLGIDYAASQMTAAELGIGFTCRLGRRFIALKHTKCQADFRGCFWARHMSQKQKMLTSLDTHWVKIVPSNTFDSKIQKLTSQALRIVATSVIQS